MLTYDFSKIIAVVLDKSRHNSLESFSSEEIYSISLILLGYLKLVKSGFKTKDDSTEPSDEYCNYLKSVLHQLTVTQDSLIHKAKIGFISDLNADLNALIKNIEMSADGRKNQIDSFRTSIKNLCKNIEDDLFNPHVGFMDAVRTGFKASFSIVDQLKEPFQNQYQNLCQKTLTYHLKRWTVWVDIEQTNQKCISYITCGDLIGL